MGLSTSPAQPWTALHPTRARVAMDWWGKGHAHVSQTAPGLIRHPPASANTDKYSTAIISPLDYNENQ